MKTEFTLRGLDCANCAAKIETAVKAMPGVESASCSAISEALVLEMAGSHAAANIAAEIERIVHKYEPHVEVGLKEQDSDSHGHEHSHSHDHKDGGSAKEAACIIAGVLLFAAAILFRNTAARTWLYLASYAVLGWRVVIKAVANLFRGHIFDECFLMSVATVGALAIGELPEAAAVMLFYLVGEFFQDRAVSKSKRSISELMDIRPDYANVLSDGELVRVSPETVQIGDTIVVRPGEKIPLDGVVVNGQSMLDTGALTGESVPRSAAQNDTVLSGCVNLSGVLTIEVTKVFGESTAAKILELVENASSRKAPTENFITTFSRYYTPAVTGLAALLAVIPPLVLDGEWSTWIHRALVFLVISCPCALVISIPLGFFAGIGRASRNGILVKGGNYLEALSDLDIVVFDKTGTLTRGVFEVTAIRPAEGFTEKELLEYAASAEAFSNHPIAVSIIRAYGGAVKESADYTEIPGYGVSVIADGKSILAGNARLMEREGIELDSTEYTGTVVFVAVDGQLAGSLVISDEIREDSHAAISGLKELGVRRTVMLTGDNSRIAEAVAGELPLDEVHAQLLPGEKVEKVEQLDAEKRRGGKLAFVGDGVNDAPVLARADVGIAMGGLGSDAAIEAADVVLMTDEPSKLVEAVRIAKRTRSAVWQNIVFALGIKLVFLILGAFAVSGMWEAVFADVGVSVLAVLNSLRVQWEKSK